MAIKILTEPIRRLTIDLQEVILTVKALLFRVIGIQTSDSLLFDLEFKYL